MSATPRDVRNVVLVGHTGAGKTTLLRHLLQVAEFLDGQPAATMPAAGNGNGSGSGRKGGNGRANANGRGAGGQARAGADGGAPGVGAAGGGAGASPGGEPAQRSISLVLASLCHRGLAVNLLDTPGYPDFVGELRAGLRAADAALFVISALEDIDGSTRMLWEECAAVGMPRAIAITRLDHPRADFDATLLACQETFGAGVLPVYLPEPGGAEPSRLVALLTGRVIEYSAGTRREQEPPAELTGAAGAARGALVEGIIAESEDESLLERYLGGEELDPKMLLDDLETAVARGSFYPVLPLAVPSRAAAGARGVPPGLGTVELLDLFAHAFPSPREHPLPSLTRPDGSPCPPAVGDPAGPLVAEIVRTTTDPYIGRMSLVRVFSGILRPDAAVHVSGHGRAAAGHPDHDDDERVGALSQAVGIALHSVDECAAGGICVITRLSTAETGDTLSDPADPRHLPAWTMPEPLLPVAVRAPARSDESKLSAALGRVCAEDPTLTVTQDAETGQLVLWSMGEAHCDVVLDRLRERFGVTLEKIPLRVPMRETLRGPAEGVGRLVKQSGGHGQYAICRLKVEPLPAGSGFEFVDEVVGGAVPRQFIPSVEKGVRAQLERGLDAGFPAVDLRVRLVDGKAHSVDSSDMAFQAAGGLALREAARAAGVVLLEPVLEVHVTVPDEHVGAVMSDVSARRGRVVGMAPVGNGGPEVPARTAIHAEIPAAEMTRYAVDLRSVSHGTGVFSRRPLGYEPVPDHLTARFTEKS
ncbi:elongation factor G-like protein EF-G2 [Parafrankia sp. BMG5.11]|uniref:elongation factor G-like protein EF-G2 n=1 Tax=Parafrankia sp. BMG5.11 TaxID=222540 RepID=UPI00103CDD21|nr:elongation factor G-like protein EF-G2 [Parafrankia sp. BMG5.11]TCJ36183.1 elongation factor G-like protein EF-G2 [Parafrankia sp. BMG5.11]